MDLGVQAGDDLEILVLIDILPVLCDLWGLGSSLLLTLAKFDPLLHCQVLTKLRERVALETQAFQDGAVGDRIKDDMVVWSGRNLSATALKFRTQIIILPGKVQNSETIDVGLVCGRRMHSVDATLDVSSSQRSQSVTSVDGNSGVLRLDPSPLSLGTENLQSSDRLTEEQSDAAEIGVAGTVEFADFLILFVGTSGVVHVPEMVFAAVVVAVIDDQLVLVWKLKEDGKEAKELRDHVLVAFL